MSKITIEELSASLKDRLKGAGLQEDEVIALIEEMAVNVTDYTGDEDIKINSLTGITSIDYTDGTDIKIEENEGADIDLSDYQQKTDNNLQTSSKELVGAINELFQSANNGKELIASAIGEPLNSEDTFSAMSNDINSLLSQFKTNMMKNGITVESGDKFKTLIDKIATMVEEGSGKGIHIIQGSLETSDLITKTYAYLRDEKGNGGTTPWVCFDASVLGFSPSIILINFLYGTNTVYDAIYDNMIKKEYYLRAYNKSQGYNGAYSGMKVPDVINTASLILPLLQEEQLKWGITNIQYIAIGVGEEDTTLRDSLADILEDEGVDVTEEDGMASLITKTDEEFDNKKQMIVTLLNNKGINVDINSSWEELLTELNKLNITVPELNLNTWTEGTPMSVARYNPAAVAVGTDLYVIGGYNTASSKANEKYDSLTGTWTSKTNINTDCSMTTGASINGIIYVVDNKFLGSYNPTTDTWTTLKSIPLRYGYTGCRAHNYNNELIIYGEAYEQGNKMFKYVPSSGTLTEITPKYQYMYEYNALAMVLVNDKIYAPGGYYIDDEHHAQNTSSIYTISPINAEYGYTNASLGSYCHYKNLFGFAINQKAYFCGGFYYSDYSDNVETSLKVWCLDTYTSSLTNTADLPFFLYDPGMAVINDVAYIVGGRTDYSTYSNKLIIYKP